MSTPAPRDDARRMTMVRPTPRTTFGLDEVAPAADDSRTSLAATTLLRSVPVPVELRELVEETKTSSVWRAFDERLHRDVSVKKLAAGSPTGLVAQFVGESLTTAALQHPNVVPVYGLGTGAAGEPLLATKLVLGRSWHAELEASFARRRGGLRHSAVRYLRRNLGIFLRVLDAVAYAHSHGVIHRDLKTENVLVGDFGEVLVVEWGLAVSSGSTDLVSESRALTIPKAPTVDQVDAAAGTPAFMAPEQARGETGAIGPATDIFLLGGALFEVLTGTPLHASSDLERVLAQARKGPARDVAAALIPKLRDAVQGELLAVVRKALAPDPARRPADVAVFRRPVEEALASVERLRVSLQGVREARVKVTRCRARLLAGPPPSFEPPAWWAGGKKVVVERFAVPHGPATFLGRWPEHVTEIESTLGELGFAQRLVDRALVIAPANVRARKLAGQLAETLGVLCTREEHYLLARDQAARLAAVEPGPGESLASTVQAWAFRSEGPLRGLRASRVFAILLLLVGSLLATLCFLDGLLQTGPAIFEELARFPSLPDGARLVLGSAGGWFALVLFQSVPIFLAREARLATGRRRAWLMARAATGWGTLLTLPVVGGAVLLSRPDATLPGVLTAVAAGAISLVVLTLPVLSTWWTLRGPPLRRLPWQDAGLAETPSKAP